MATLHAAPFSVDNTRTAIRALSPAIDTRAARELLGSARMKYPLFTNRIVSTIPSTDAPAPVVIDEAALGATHGGMKWQNMCSSYNVEDRRPGAGTRAQQRARTDQWNREAGCPTWADLHPAKRRR